MLPTLAAPAGWKWGRRRWLALFAQSVGLAQMTARPKFASETTAQGAKPLLLRQRILGLLIFSRLMLAGTNGTVRMLILAMGKA